MPNTHREKNLLACTGCRLVMSDTQWKSKSCPNCLHDENQSITPHFSGLISLFMPTNSWVARWNKLEGMKPGIYAITVLDEDPFEQDQYYEAIEDKPKKQQKSKKQEGLYSDDEVEEYYKFS